MNANRDSEGAEGGAQRDLAAGLASIWEKYRPSVEEQVRTIEAAAVGLMEGTLSSEERREAERAAHKLAGAAGTFGFGRTSELAREAEHLLFESTDIGGPEILRLSEIAVSLGESLKEPPASAPPAPGAADGTLAGTNAIVIVDRDTESRQRLSLEAEGRGLTVLATDSLAEARELAAGENVQAVVIDPDLSDGLDAGLRFVSELSSWSPPVPAVVLSQGEGLAARIEVARRNAKLYLQKPVSPKRAMDAIQRALGSFENSGAKIMIVDDSPEVLEAVAVLLRQRGFEVATLEDPLEFWPALQDADPDLLLLDVDMPHVNGIELCRVVRNDERWGNLPVIFLTALRDAQTIADVFAAGADDFVSKPLIETEFLVRITNRLERVRLIKELTETDHLTGLLNRQRSTQAIEQILALANSEDRGVALALIDVDGLRNINAALGFAEGDRLLRRLGVLLGSRLGSEDVAGRWAGEEFVIAMYGATKEEMIRLLDPVATELKAALELDSGLAATFSAGIARSPDDGVDLADLQRAAAQALGEAKRNGGASMVAIGWTEGRQVADALDVIVVEDDDALAELLTHAIENRGLRVQRFGDGATAADAILTGRLEPRAALLDVDLPGLDGLSLLKQMSDAGITARTKVVMLTARSAEIEVLRAMELGAFDHVAKPFSIPVLLQRLSRALGEG